MDYIYYNQTYYIEIWFILHFKFGVDKEKCHKHIMILVSTLGRYENDDEKTIIIKKGPL